MFMILQIPTDMLGGASYIFQNYFPMFLFGVRNTLYISLISTIIGLFIGLFFATLKNLRVQKKDALINKIIKYFFKGISNVYIEVFRGTPMMVQAVFLYYGLRPVLNWIPLQAAIVIVSVNTGAYMAEIIRAGIQSLDDGQYEAARSIGMNHSIAMTTIILPQAIRNSFP